MMAWRILTAAGGMSRRAAQHASHGPQPAMGSTHVRASPWQLQSLKQLPLHLWRPVLEHCLGMSTQHVAEL